ncbi:MAG TPA: phage/plasmid primase, P4 family [Pyrinomonadaceae bacterium]|jgi:putative DNA primase/helicase
MSTAKLKVVQPAPATFILSFFNRKSDNKPNPQQMSWEEFVARFSRPSIRQYKDGELFSPAAFIGTRAKENVTEACMLVLDYDHKADIKHELQMWRDRGYTFIAYTTYSHTVTEHHFRIVIPLASPIPADQFPLLWQWAFASSGGKIDRAASDISRMFYTPAIAGKDAAWLFESVEGSLLDWRTLNLQEAKPAHVRKVDASAQVGTLRLNQDAEPPVKWSLLCEAEPRALASFNHTRRTPDGSASSYDMALANYAARAGWTEQEIADLIIAHRRTHNAKPKADLQDYLARTITEARSKATLAAALAPAQLDENLHAVCVASTRDGSEQRAFKLSDYGNAERLVVRHGADLRFCHQLTKWFVWSGDRWREDATAEVTRRAKETVRAMYEEAAGIPDLKERESFVKFVLRSEAEARIAAMIALAESERGIPVLQEELDADPFLFNCANGTLDLRTGRLREHRPEDLITKLSPVIFDTQARSDMWELFLRDATGGDADLEKFLQRATGYSLTGDTREEVLFFIHGPQAAGKSTFMETIKAALGDYARTSDFEAFLSRRDVGSPRNDIARLAGARFVASIEVDEGKKLAEGLVKVLTGGDTVAVRFLHREFFEFRPPFKLWLAANHAPRVRDDDEAMWRRILRVPFVHTIPKAQRDPKIKAQLRDAATAGPAVLAWMLRGCLDWQRDGLRVPQAVEEATQEYRESQDPLKDFIADCCVLTPATWTPTAALRAEYERWTKERGERHPLVGTAFTARLKARGCTPKVRLNVRGWLGVGLAGGN